MKTVRVAIVGCGRMGKERARSCSQSGAVVAYVCDSDLERSQALAERYQGCSVVAEAGNVPYADVDAVFVCIPPGYRGTIERAAIAIGTPFFVEKPIGVSAAAALPVIRALSAKRVINAAGYMNRYRSSIQHARRVLRGCRLLGITGYWVGRKYDVPWWLDPFLSGGPVNEQATHLLDMCRYLVGEVDVIESLSSQAAPILRTAAILHFQNGCLGTVFYSCEARDKQIGFRIVAEEGGLDLTGWDLRLSANSIDGTLPENQTEDNLQNETQQFLEAVRSGSSHHIECTFEDAFRTQLLVDSMQKVTVAGSSEQ